ncbi:MAG: hypothetical protein ABI559_05345 [Chloroflexota bacterium]
MAQPAGRPCLRPGFFQPTPDYGLVTGGNLDCSAQPAGRSLDVTTADVMRYLQFFAGLPLAPIDECPTLGEEVSITFT